MYIDKQSGDQAPDDENELVDLFLMNTMGGGVHFKCKFVDNDLFDELKRLKNWTLPRFNI